MCRLSLENITTRIHVGYARKRIVFVDPTSDERLFKFLFSIPDELFNYMGKEKFLYKQMMQHEDVLKYIDTNTRRHQSLDIPFRLKKSLDKALINFKLTQVLNYIDVGAVKQNLNELYEGDGDYMQKRGLSTNLLRKLSLINFISKNISKFDIINNHN